MAKMDNSDMYFYRQVDPSQVLSHAIILGIGYQQCTLKCWVRRATFRRNDPAKPGNTLRPLWHRNNKLSEWQSKPHDLNICRFQRHLKQNLRLNSEA